MKARSAVAFLFVSLSIAAQNLTPDFSAIRHDLQARVGHDDVPGLAIAVATRGKTVWEEGFGWADRERHTRATANVPFYIASVTKSITATAIMRLNEQGRLRLDDPVNKYLGATKLHSPMWNASDATLRRVLSHTGGLTTFSRWCTPGGPQCNIEREIKRYGVLVWPPGEVFDYSNLGYGVLGYVVARVSGRPLDSYLRDAIFRPLQMRDCAIMLNSSLAHRAAAQYNEKTHARSPERISGHPGASGLHCSAHDLLLFAESQLDDDARKPSPLTDRDIAEMHRAQPGTHGQYGLGWWIKQQSGVEIISAQGGTSDSYALVELVPTRDIAIVIVANSYSKLVSDLEGRIRSVLLPGVAAGTEPPNSAPPIGAAPALVGKWSGQILTYRGVVNVTLEIGENGTARGQIGNSSISPATDVSVKPKHFFCRLRGDAALPDAPRGTYLMDLDLALHGNELIGAATSGPPPGRDGDQLPHWAKLSRTGR